MHEDKRKSLSEYIGEDRVVSSHEMALKFASQKGPRVQVMSKIPSLDAACEGFCSGEVIPISGPTKNGKTTLAQTLTINFERQNVFSLWFTFEVQAEHFLDKFVRTPLIYMPMKLKPHAMPWVEERILESLDKYNTRVVFIDHLHYLVDMARIKNPSLEIGSVIRQLKLWAVEHELIVFLMCHTTKGKPDNLSYDSIRDSSFVAQESDSVLMIKRLPEEGENRAGLKVEFHRRTGVMERKIELIKMGPYLFEYTERATETRARADLA